MVQVVPGALAAALVNLAPCGMGLAHSHAHVDGLAFILESNPELEVGYVKGERVRVKIARARIDSVQRAKAGETT